MYITKEEVEAVQAAIDFICNRARKDEHKEIKGTIHRLNIITNKGLEDMRCRERRKQGRIGLCI